MIDDYLTHTVAWKKRLGVDAWNEGEYAEPVEIPARVEESVRAVEGPGGRELRQTTEVYVARSHDVRVGDLVDPRLLGGSPGQEDYQEVEARSSQTGLFGEVEAYVLYFEPVANG